METRDVREAMERAGSRERVRRLSAPFTEAERAWVIRAFVGWEQKAPTVARGSITEAELGRAIRLQSAGGAPAEAPRVGVTDLRSPGRRDRFYVGLTRSTLAGVNGGPA